MLRPLSKKDLDILEVRGYWIASSSLHNAVKKMIRVRLPLRIGLIKHAHQIMFKVANLAIAGKYRRDNPEVKRIDGSLLKIAHWQNIPNAMAELDEELQEKTKSLQKPRTESDYQRIITIATQLSHRLACIHPFENGNGRSSRLLLGAILLRAELPDISIKAHNIMTKESNAEIKELKAKYLRAMFQADNGDFSLLENMIMSGLVENKKKLYTMKLRKQAEAAKIRGRLRNKSKKKK